MPLKNNCSITKFREFCYRCYRPKSSCFCSLVKSFDTRIKIIILMHPKEAKYERNGTGRLARLALNNSEIIIGIDFTHNPRVNDIIFNEQNLCYLLYPGDKALSLEYDNIDDLLKTKKNIVVFVIDGTWPCAKKMVRLSKNISSLSRISLTPTKASRFFIKEQPQKFCLSTIEAIHLLLSVCQNRMLEYLDNKHDNLIELLDQLVKFQIDCAKNPDLKSYRVKKEYSDVLDRTPSLKWKKRKIFAKD